MALLRERAAAQGGPVVDLSIGAPVDPTPEVVRRALGVHADWPGYPLTTGTRALREAQLGWLARRHGVVGVTGLDAAAVLPVPGTKEVIGSLPLHLGLTPDDVVALPRLAYPTYAVGAAVVGARIERVDDLADLQALEAAGVVPRLLWLNSPSNPTGRVQPAAALAALVAWCRARGTLVVSDECYLDLGWEATPVSVLHPDVSGGDPAGLLAVHSLSKRSNLAGYRIGFVTGDPALVADLTSIRRNLGLGVAGPQQGAAVAALEDEDHVTAQRARYAARRAVLLPALRHAGFRVEHSEAGLYLWATRDEPATVTLDALVGLGIVAISGAEYGPEGAAHVRFALTAPDADVALAARRLADAPAPRSPEESA
ncbi:succinyldiaminopimelate transaminase [Nocardioides sp.]|uniref:succinyldiaminopimelate transaminase n=1 Tax=Nocardioides sp. TaxID=35761 RepID=UPI003518981E